MRTLFVLENFLFLSDASQKILVDFNAGSIFLRAVNSFSPPPLGLYFNAGCFLLLFTLEKPDKMGPELP